MRKNSAADPKMVFIFAWPAGIGVRSSAAARKTVCTGGIRNCTPLP